MPNTPNINIVDGTVTGTLTKNGIFYWYNPTSNDEAITIENVGTWCVSSKYTIPPGSQQYATAQILANPNENPYAWTESPNQWNAAGGGPHLGAKSPGGGTPIVSIQNGMVSGNLQSGQAFSWNNPNPVRVKIADCGAWCGASTYDVGPGGLTAASYGDNPNGNPCAWTESPNRWNAPGLPHVGNPPWPTPKNAEKEVA